MTWAAAQARELGDGAQVLLLIREDDGVLRPTGRAPSDWQPPEPVRNAVSAAAEHGKPALREAGPERTAIALAIRVNDVAAVAAAEIPTADPARATLAIRQLQWGSAGVEAYLRRQSTAPAMLTEQVADTRAADALRLIVRALETEGYKDAARIAATELALNLGASRIAIARKRRRARVEALSHTATIEGRTKALDLLNAAADEALDQGDLLEWPPAENAPPLARRQLEQLAKESGAGSVAALPMGPVEKPWGALVAEFADVDAAQRQLPVLDIAGDALAPLLEVKRRNDRWWIMRAVEGLWHGAGVLFGPRGLGWKLVALVLVGLTIAALTITAPARVTADAEITSDGRVVLSSPFEGFLLERLTRVGDRVEQGQLLARLDDRDLRLDQLRLTAERRQREVERDAAIAANDRAQLSVLTAQIAETDAQLALNEAQIAASFIRAPFAGSVTLDATEGKTGAPVARGAEMMVLAPLDQRRLTLHVPDAGVDRIALGQTGTLRLSAMPESPMSFEITHITPLTEAREGENTFRVEAALTGDIPADIGLGMEGVAKVVTGRDLWVLTWAKPFYESMRLRLWSLWP